VEADFQEGECAGFEKLYASVKIGQETREVIRDCGGKDYKKFLEKKLAEIHDSEMWQAGAAVRSLRPRKKPKNYFGHQRCGRTGKELKSLINCRGSPWQTLPSKQDNHERQSLHIRYHAARWGTGIGLFLSVDQKMRIARQLARLNVDIIEAGFPISSPGDFESVSTIAREIKGQSSAPGEAHRKRHRRMRQSPEACKRPRIHTFVGTSAIHMEKKLRKTNDEVIDMAIRAVKLCRKYCDDVEFSPEDAGRTDPDFLCRIVETAIRAARRP